MVEVGSDGRGGDDDGGNNRDKDAVRRGDNWTGRSLNSSMDIDDNNGTVSSSPRMMMRLLMSFHADLCNCINEGIAAASNCCCCSCCSEEEDE